MGTPCLPCTDRDALDGNLIRLRLDPGAVIHAHHWFIQASSYATALSLVNKIIQLPLWEERLAVKKGTFQPSPGRPTRSEAASLQTAENSTSPGLRVFLNSYLKMTTVKWETPLKLNGFIHKLQWWGGRMAGEWFPKEAFWKLNGLIHSCDVWVS